MEFSYQRNRLATQVSPLPKATITMSIPGLIVPSRTASSKAMGMLAAVGQFAERDVLAAHELLADPKFECEMDGDQVVPAVDTETAGYSFVKPKAQSDRADVRVDVSEGEDVIRAELRCARLARGSTAF